MVNSKTKKYSNQEILYGESTLFNDAIRKAFLLYLIKYSKSISVQQVNIEINGINEFFDSNIEFPLYSLISGELYRKVSKEFATDKVFDYLLSSTKTKDGKRMSALFAYLLSKSKRYENERFIYLWTSLNGIYSFISRKIFYANGLETNNIFERNQLLCFMNFYNIGEELTHKKIRNKLVNEIRPILCELNSFPISKQKLEDLKVFSKIEEVLNNYNNEKFFRESGKLLSCSRKKSTKSFTS